MGDLLESEYHSPIRPEEAQAVSRPRTTRAHMEGIPYCFVFLFSGASLTPTDRVVEPGGSSSNSGAQSMGDFGGREFQQMKMFIGGPRTTTTTTTTTKKVNTLIRTKYYVHTDSPLQKDPFSSFLKKVEKVADKQLDHVCCHVSQRWLLVGLTTSLLAVVQLLAIPLLPMALLLRRREP